jgi:hypothetical protein
VLISTGGRGAEKTYKPQTNDTELYWMIDKEFSWSSDFMAQQKLLDEFAERNGLDEVPLADVRRTYTRWEYGKGNHGRLYG